MRNEPPAGESGTLCKSSVITLTFEWQWLDNDDDHAIDEEITNRAEQCLILWLVDDAFNMVRENLPRPNIIR